MGSLDDASTEIQVSDMVLGSGSEAERVIFGVVPEGIVRVEATTAGGSAVSADVLDVPDEIDPNLNAFVLVAPPGRVDMRGYDASGNVIARGSTGSAEAPSPTGSP
jgi:hypothetical protein